MCSSRKTIFFFFGLIYFFIFIEVSANGVILTPASGGEAILSSTINSSFINLSDLIFKEIDSGQIGVDDSDLMLTIPQEFEFDVATKVTATAVNTKLDESGNCAGSGNRTLRLGNSASGALSLSVFPETQKITFHIKQASLGNCKATLTISGLRIRPTITSNFSGFITYEGTAQIHGLEQLSSKLSELNIINDVEPDIEAPIITLTGSQVLEIEVGDQFLDPGASAFDTIDGVVDVVASGDVNTEVLGEYKVKYESMDKVGNVSMVYRTIQVVDTEAPKLFLQGPEVMYIKLGSTFSDPGVVVEDNYDENILPFINGIVDAHTLGTYTIEYSAVDQSGNQSLPIFRTVIVKDKNPPKLNLIGPESIIVEAGSSYVDQGAVALDSDDNDISHTISVIGIPLDTKHPGNYEIIYSVSIYEAGEEIFTESVIRTLHIVDTTPPTLTLLGSSQIKLFIDEAYTDLGATAQDIVDGDMTASIETEGLPPSKGEIGQFVIKYFVVDSNGNKSEIVRNIEVIEREEIITNFSSKQGSKKEFKKATPIASQLLPKNFISTLPSTPEVLGTSTKRGCEEFDKNMIELERGNQIEIKKLQEFLNKKLILAIPVTGMMGELTEFAFEFFQNQYQCESN